MRIFNPKTVASFISLEKQERAGYLGKKRSENKLAYKRRYFIAAGNLLAYYGKRSDREPIGLIILEGHVVEMVDDLTMCLKFPSDHGTTRPYFLRSDSCDDAEQWIRLLSRSGIDFVTLSIQELEESLEAIKLSRPQSASRSERVTTRDSSPTQKSSPLQARANPFNTGTSLFKESLVTQSKTVRNINTGEACQSSTSQSCHEVQKPSSEISETGPISRSSITRSHTPSVDHLAWLFSCDWPQLHSHLAKQLRRVDPVNDQTNPPDNNGGSKSTGP